MTDVTTTGTTTAPTATPVATPTATPGTERRALAGGALAMVFVGGSVALSGLLDPAALGPTQALRYALAAVVLVVGARSTGVRVPRPRGTDWLWLVGVAGTGLVLFNVALVRGAREAEPAVLGVAVAAVPLVLALGGALLQRRRPRPAVLVAAALVTVGAVVVQGTGDSTAAGLGYAVLTLVCEACFTLLAVPVLTRLGAFGVSVHTTWLAAVGFVVLGLVTGPADAVLRLTVRDLVVVVLLALFVTAGAFVLWYRAVDRAGPGRAGLLTGIAPVAATGTGALLGDGLPPWPVLVGVAVVGLGLAIGLAPGRRPRSVVAAVPTAVVGTTTAGPVAGPA